jgi:hypothetical protein
VRVVINDEAYVSEAQCAGRVAVLQSAVGDLRAMLAEIEAEVGLCDSIGLAAAVSRLERIRELALEALADTRTVAA